MRLVVRVFGAESVIERAEVVEVCRHEGGFSKGIRIVHKSQRVSPLLVFWHPAQSELLSRLRDRGYPTSE